MTVPFYHFSSPPSQPGHQGSKAATKTGPPKEQCKAKFRFVPAEDEELEFEEGDIITILEKSDPNWYKGECKGRIGLFPTNYVTIL